MTTAAILGLQWGDEGKGKIVDYLSATASAVVRFQGGHNAGHTICHEGGKTVLHLLPSGALHPNTACLIGQGVVVSPEALLNELQSVEKLGFSLSPRLTVSPNCPLLLECHTLVDRAREQKLAGAAIGTTGRGIGPAYEDKTARRGLRVLDILSSDTLGEKIFQLYEYHNFMLKNYYRMQTADPDKAVNFLLSHTEQIRPLIGSVEEKMEELNEDGSLVIFEGAQGSLLDLDFGSYPYVTSSHTIAPNIYLGSGFPQPVPIDKTIGIIKVYTTRVGNGPFPSEIGENDRITKHLVKRGKEFGATTGRKRRCGWLDLVKLKQAVAINGVTALCLTKLDVMSGIEEIKLCIDYKKHTDTGAGNLDGSHRPVYRTVPGWKEDISGITEFKNLPPEAIHYVKEIERSCGVPAAIISTGCQRLQNIVRSNPLP